MYIWVHLYVHDNIYVMWKKSSCEAAKAMTQLGCRVGAGPFPLPHSIVGCYSPHPVEDNVFDAGKGILIITPVASWI